MADQQVAAPVEQIDGEEIRCARHTGAAVAGHGGSSLSVVLARGPCYLTHPRAPPTHRRCRSVGWKTTKRSPRVAPMLSRNIAGYCDSYNVLSIAISFG